MNVQDRLLAFLKYKRLSKLAFSKSIGRSTAYVTNIVESIGAQSRLRIKEVYPELNMDWLLRGEGEMINKFADDTVEENTDKSNKVIEETVPLLPISAQAGRLCDFTQGVTEVECERIISPISNAELALTITGDSLSPEYTSGTKVLVKKINDKAFIDWGRTYVLDTCNGVVIKNVYPSEKDNAIRCVSVNPNYPPFDIEKNDIYGWYVVLMSLSLK